MYIITKSPPEQNSISKIDRKQLGRDIKPLNDYLGGFLIFDVVLKSNGAFRNDLFLTRGRQKKEFVFYLSQSFLVLPRQRKINISY